MDVASSLLFFVENMHKTLPTSHVLDLPFLEIMASMEPSESESNVADSKPVTFPATLNED
jgi:hypothetical protein